MKKKIQMPGVLPGGVFKLRFDWHISSFKKEGKKENNLKDREVERKKEE